MDSPITYTQYVCISELFDNNFVVKKSWSKFLHLKIKLTTSSISPELCRFKTCTKSRDGPTPWVDVQILTPIQFFWVELECTPHPNPTTVVDVGAEWTSVIADCGGTHSFQHLEISHELKSS